MSLASLRATSRRLYKELLWAGRNHPDGLDAVRRGAKKAFLANRDETDPRAIKVAHHRARYMIRELEALEKLRKYRAIKQRYEAPTSAQA